MAEKFQGIRGQKSDCRELRGEERKRVEKYRQAMLVVCQESGFWKTGWPDKCSK